MNRLSLDSRMQTGIVRRSGKLTRILLSRAWEYGLSVQTLPCKATLINAGFDTLGSLEAGRILVEICHGGLANASLDLTDLDGFILPQITVESLHPVFSTYGLQASYPLSVDEPGVRVSGPIRLCLGGDSPAKDALGIAVIESDCLPDDAFALHLAEESGIPPQMLTLIAAPIASVVGATQIAGRVNESVIFTMKESLNVDPHIVKHIVGRAPVCPVSGGAAPTENRRYPDDFIHYAGAALLTVDGFPDDGLDELAHRLSFESASIYGRLFWDVLQEAGGVFEKIPDLNDINKPAQVTINHLSSGRVSHAGKMDVKRLVDLIEGRDCDAL